MAVHQTAIYANLRLSGIDLLLYHIVNPIREWIMGNPQQGYLQKVSSRSVYDIVKLSMFKTNQFYKTAPLPCDEAGPIRKETFEKKNKWNENTFMRKQYI